MIGAVLAIATATTCSYAAKLKNRISNMIILVTVKYVSCFAEPSVVGRKIGQYICTNEVYIVKKIPIT